MESLTLYANSIRSQTYELPQLLTDDKTIEIEVTLKGLSSKFVSYKQGNFKFTPKETHVGSYNIDLRARDIKTGKKSRAVNWNIKVLSQNLSSDAASCPKGAQCLPKISEVTQDGIVEIKFPYKLRTLAPSPDKEYYLRNISKALLFNLKVQQN